MNILVIEGSTPQISIAVKTPEKIYQESEHCRNISDNILALIERVLKKTVLNIKKIDILSAGIGPGSFTGLRIVCSLLKGFELVLKKPLITISSFYAVAAQHIEEKEKIAVIKDAKRGLVYGTVFQKKNGQIKHLIPEALFDLKDFVKKHTDTECVFSGESCCFKDTIKNILPEATIIPEIIYPQASLLLSGILNKLQQGNFTPFDKLEPLYLHRETCQIRKT